MSLRAGALQLVQFYLLNVSSLPECANLNFVPLFFNGDLSSEGKSIFFASFWRLFLCLPCYW